MEGNLVVVEVKSITNDVPRIVDDAMAVAAFVTHASYAKGVCLVYGKELRRLERLRVALRKEQSKLAGVVLIHHRESSQQADIVDWAP